MVPCWSCHGAQLIDDPYPLPPGPDEPLPVAVTRIPCPPCQGKGSLWSGIQCHLCESLLPCWCDIEDARMRAADNALEELLRVLEDPTLAGIALRELRACLTLARRAAQVDDIIEHLDKPCPACKMRALAADCSSPDRALWTISCRSKLCVCTGSGCACDRTGRREGQIHLWKAADWDGPDGLAYRLGIREIGTRRVWWWPPDDWHPPLVHPHDQTAHEVLEPPPKDPG